MPSKKELQSILREQYGINKNVSQALATEDCEQLLTTLQRDPSAARLVDAFAEKNADLGKRNQYFGRMRSNAEGKLQASEESYQQLETQVAQVERAKVDAERRLQASEKNYQQLSARSAQMEQAKVEAERKLQALQVDYRQLSSQVSKMEQVKLGLEDRKSVITGETKTLEAEIGRLQSEKQNLTSRVQTLTTQNDELSDANVQLKKDNKDLKNLVDQIRLRLARDTKALLQYEDNEIRKAMIRLFRWTLG